MSGTRHSTYLTDRIGPLPYCPGCSHEPFIQALDKALVKLQPDPEKVVIVTDIGCIGLSDRYFITSAFHGLHGRSITYACGLKLARPELTVVALKGDGGCGIGGTHLLNVARRNIGITLIVANNFNYGMTGGQHSVTTPTGGVTSTTPWGNVEGPMDLCGAAVAAGAAWVYRATAFDKDLADVIATAIEQPGFAMIDVWELCTAYYTPRNQLKKRDILALLGEHGLESGLQVDRPRPEYSARYRAVYQAGEQVTLARVEAAYNRILKDREMRRDLARMERAGAMVRYYQADVRDEQAMANLIEGIYQDYGRLDGVIHGAGIIEDNIPDLHKHALYGIMKLAGRDKQWIRELMHAGMDVIPPDRIKLDKILVVLKYTGNGNAVAFLNYIRELPVIYGHAGGRIL